MSDLSKELEQFIFNWRPCSKSEFEIDLKYSLAETFEAAKENSYVVGFGYSYGKTSKAWFDLDPYLLGHTFQTKARETA